MSTEFSFPHILRVLLIEDNPGDARLLSELLRDAGPSSIELDHAPTLEAGLEALGARGHDVILLDLSLPRFAGLEGLRVLRKEASDTPVLILTGTDNEELAVSAVREGAQDYLVKGDLRGSLVVRAMHYAVERRRSETEIRRLSGEIMRIQEEERNRLSREIHDVIGQGLVALKFQIQNVISDDVSRIELHERCAGIIAYINEILKQTREMSHSLSPIALQRLGLNRAVVELTASLARAHRIAIDTDLDHVENFFPDNWDINTYRIVQEAVLNAIKHASASRIEVFARKTNDRLTIRIRDDGIGLDSGRRSQARLETKSGLSDTGGLGLLIMRERAELVGGSIEVHGSASGTEVVFELERARYRARRVPI